MSQRHNIVILLSMNCTIFFKTVIGLVFFIQLSMNLFANKNRAGQDSLSWNTINKKEYTLHYTNDDKNLVNDIDRYHRSGLNYIPAFLDHSFLKKFDVYIFPDRSSLDKQWQNAWGDSTFKTECWMIGGAVGNRLDILSLNVWAKEACDHNAQDSTEIRKFIWHELVHVFHGQYNPDHMLNVEKLDWLVEGVATYVSGQLDEKRLQRVKQLVRDNKTPSTLDDFWKGQEKYGLSGSAVAFIDKKYGKEKLFALLKCTNKQDALKSLGLSEEQLLKEWKESF